MNNLEKTILKWLETRNDGWCWFFGSKKLDKKTTVEKFKRDKQFRKLVVTQVEKTAIEMFDSHLKKEGKL
jgi:hypothetical protein